MVIDRHITNQGMKWIRHEKRLAIYLRDGLACAYCGAAVEDGVKLTLDHLKPHCKGGSNKETNLATCCLVCNSSRGNRPWKEFAAKAAEYIDRGRTAESIISYITSQTKRKLDVAAAKEMIARRGGFTSALYGKEI